MNKNKVRELKWNPKKVRGSALYFTAFLLLSQDINKYITHLIIPRREIPY